MEEGYINTRRQTELTKVIKYYERNRSVNIVGLDRDAYSGGFCGA